MNSLGKKRKSSITDEEYEEARDSCYQDLRTAIDILPKDDHVICFTSSMLVRAVECKDPFCNNFLYWRYSEKGRITADCDVIFKNDPSKDDRQRIRRYNRDKTKKGLYIDWRKSKHYNSDAWADIKNRSFAKAENINDISVQPLDVIIYAKSNVLTDPKHKEDAEILKKLKFF